MIRLHDLIAALQEQAAKHQNIECDVWIMDGDNNAMKSGTMPAFTLSKDKEHGDLLSIDFRGVRD